MPYRLAALVALDSVAHFDIVRVRGRGKVGMRKVGVLNGERDATHTKKNRKSRFAPLDP